MPNDHFRFKQFTVSQRRSAMKVTTDACLFGAWCAKQLQPTASEGTTLLDIGTGTGLLSLMVAQKTGAVVDAIEIDGAAAEEAASNAAASPWGNKISVHHKDVLGWTGRYDFIISNPPFFERSLLSPHGARNAALHSTHLKLPQLLTAVEALLSATGYFFLLLPHYRLHELKTEVNKTGLRIHKTVAVQHSVCHEPFRAMVWGSRELREERIAENIAVKDGSNLYTPQFVELLKDYYLYL